MHKSTKSRFVTVICVTVLLLVTAMTASADTHYQEVIYLDEAWTVPVAESPCDFALEMHSWGSVRVNYWLDDNGQVTQRIESYGTVRNTVSANGKTMNFHGQGPVQVRFEGNNFATVKFLGPNWLFIAPGYGKVLGSVGQEVWECTIDPVTHEENCVLVKLVGSHEWEDPAAFCEYFSG